MSPVAVFLIHGLGGHSFTLMPLQMYLKWQGYTNVHIVGYDVATCSNADEALNEVDEEMRKYSLPAQGPVVVIGQSMGGVLAHRLHGRGWDVKKSISIGSPLHGARVLNQLENALPEIVANWMRRPLYAFLQSKEREAPPAHDYHTISLGWGWSDFDGCVYQDETRFSDEQHTHLSWADHRSVFFNPRLLFLVGNLLET